jgi:Rrf2 family transcriptional regulator, nitric oxide-sensitive transcriptional repressor
MFSQTVEYALRAAVHLAMNSGTPQTTAQIADSTRLPMAYLSKILQGLQREKIVQLQRGVGGGVSLAIAPEELTILDIVNAVDPIQRIETCPLSLSGHGRRLCSLHKKMDDAAAHTENTFSSTTLAHLLADSNPTPALCEA